MQTGLKITAFAAGLAAAFGSAYAVGGALDPVAAPKKPTHQEGREVHGGKGLPAAEEGVGEAAELPGGLQVSQEGFTLDLDTPRIEAGEPAELRFAVVDEGASRNVTAFRREHGKELHLVVASNDLATYRHLHPERAADGTWSAPSNSPRPAATGCSPTSPRTGRVPRESSSARTSPYPATRAPSPCRTPSGR